jgi:hypothetical protein
LIVELLTFNSFFPTGQPLNFTYRTIVTICFYYKNHYMKMSQRAMALLCASLFFLLFSGCKHDEGVAPTTVKEWSNLVLKAVFETPAPAGRNEEGEANLRLLSDNSLEWDFHIHNLTPGDQLTAAHVHFGDAVTAGPVFINLNPTFAGPGASGKVIGLRQGQVDTLMTLPVYINVHSSQQPAGIVRSQMGQTIDFAMDIPLSGANEVPAVATTATGTAILRIVGDSLISKVSVTGVEANDTLTVSHIHRGAIGVNGPVRVFLANSLADFGITRVTFLPDSMDTMVKGEACYVNVHSRRNPPGKIRGPIR